MGVQINGDTGNISATKADYSGNVTIGGTLTYEDVTNIDSVGLVTARNGIEIGARPGVAASISVDGNMIVSGISTFGGDVQVPDKIIHSGDTNTAIRFPAADTVTVETGGSEAIRVDSSQNFGVGTNSPTARFDVRRGDTDGKIAEFHQSTGYGIDIGSSQSLAYISSGYNQNWAFKTDSGSGQTERLRIDSSGRLLKSGQASLTSTSLNHPIQVAAASDATAIAIFGRAADDIGEMNFYEADKSTNLGEIQYRQDHANIRHRVGYISFATGGITERLRIDSTGRLLLNTTTEGNAGADDLTIGQISGSTGITIRSGTTNNGNLYFSDGTSGDDEYRGSIQYQHANNSLHIATNALERLIIDSSGRVLVGGSSALSISGHTPRFQMQGTDYNTQTLSLVSNSADANPAYLFFSKQRSGAVGGSTIVQDGDRIGEIRFNGHDGNDFAHETGLIASEVDGTPGTNDMPGRLVFYTCSDNAGAVTERLRIISNGQTKMSNNGTYQSSSGTFHEMRNSSTNQHITWFTHTGVGDVQYGIRIQTANEQNDTSHNYIDCREGGSATRRFIVYANGNVQNQNNSYGSLSDEKLKENITDANSQWDDIKTLKVRNFNFINDSNKVKYLGLVAQEAETVCPSLVFTSPDTEDDSETGEIKETGTETKSLKYSVLYMKAIKCLQEAQTRIETLESRLDAAGL